MDAFILDIRTMALMASLASVLQVVALGVLWRTAPHSAGPAHWAAGGGLLAVGMLLIAFRNLIPDFLSIVLANTVIAGSHAAYLIGIQKYLGLPESTKACAVLLGITAGFFIVFTYIEPDIANRIVLISIALVILSAYCAIQFFKKHGRALAVVEWMLAVLFICHAFFHVIRGTYSGFAEHGLSNLMNASIIHGLAFIDIVIFSFIVGIGFSVATVFATNRALQSELEARSELLSIIAHDVRTPFSGLIGATHLIQANLKQGKIDDVAKFADLLSREAEGVHRLLEDLIIWGKAQFSDAEAANTDISLAELVGGIMATFESDAAAKQLSIKTDFARPEIRADKDIVAMAVRNFLSNAVKYSPQGGTILVETVESRSGTDLTVSDNGAGLDPILMGSGSLDTDQLAAHALAGGPSNPGRKGMGVGLALCARTCKRHGYALGIAGNKSGGVTARIGIPFA